ncbi:MAG: hypothetical protein QGD94_07030, partial [Planctomycetia bacterium]|nr:hypothetical protein [Planctomycetia bacterium]
MILSKGIETERTTALMQDNTLGFRRGTLCWCILLASCLCMSQAAMGQDAKPTGLRWRNKTPPVFTTKQDVKMNLFLKNFDAGPHKGRLTYSITDYYEKVVAKASRKIKVDANSTFSFQPGLKLKKKGIFRAQVSFEGASGEKKKAAIKFTFAVLDPLPADASKLDAESPFGMGIYIGRHHGYYKQAADLAYAIGVKSTRHEFSWVWVEPSQDKFNLGPSVSVNLAHERGMHILGMLGYCTDWASAAPKDAKYYRLMAPPKDMADYADYVYRVVRAYKDKVKYWEIWNEPNQTTFWHPKPDPAVYTQLCKAGYEAAKKADPDCTVVGGATVWTDLTFIEEVFKHGGFKYMDAVSVHPYRYPLPPDAPYGRYVSGGLRMMLERIDALLKGKAGAKALSKEELAGLKKKVALLEQILAGLDRITEQELTEEQLGKEIATLEKLMGQDLKLASFAKKVPAQKVAFGTIDYLLRKLKRMTGDGLVDKTVAEELMALKKLIDKYGGGKAIWISELGWPSNIGPRGISDKLQAEYLIRMYVACISVPTVEVVQWYNFKNDVYDPKWTEANFGIVTVDMRPKPAYVAFATMTSQLRGLKPHRTLNLGKGLMGYSFKADGDKETLVLWATGEPAEAKLKLKDRKFTIVDIMGNAAARRTKRGVATVRLTSSP